MSSHSASRPRRRPVPRPAVPCQGRPRRSLCRPGRGVGPRGGAEADPGPPRRPSREPGPLRPEAEITGRLEHPGIVPVYGLGHYADGRPFYAMRFIRGDSLKEAIDGSTRPTPTARRDPGERALELRELLRPVHRRLQRDGLRPQPRRPSPRPEARQHDARQVRRDPGRRLGPGQAVGRADAPAETSTGPVRSSDGGDAARGTRRWAAVGHAGLHEPRAGRGPTRRLGPASDVYSLGATLYCLLTGQAAVPRTATRDRSAKVERGDFPPPRQVKPGVPRPLEAVCLKAMARKPAGPLRLAAGPGRRHRALAGRRAGLGLARAVAVRAAAGPVGTGRRWRRRRRPC